MEICSSSPNLAGASQINGNMLRFLRTQFKVSYSTVYVNFGKTQTIKVCSPLVQSSYQGFWSSLFGHLTKSNLVIIFWSSELVLLRNFKSYKNIFF